MSATSQPTRLPRDVYDAAAATAAVSSRSVAQQIAHWARLGRELELSPDVDLRAVTRVLQGATSYDDLGTVEQAAVREQWAERAAARAQALDLASEFRAAGRSYSEVDDEGNLVLRPVSD